MTFVQREWSFCAPGGGYQVWESVVSTDSFILVLSIAKEEDEEGFQWGVKLTHLGGLYRVSDGVTEEEKWHDGPGQRIPHWNDAERATFRLAVDMVRNICNESSKLESSLMERPGEEDDEED